MPRCALLPAGGQGRRASSHRKGKALSETRERIRDGIACATRLRNKRCRTVAQWSAGDFVGPSALLRSALVARVMFAGGISPLSLACTHRTELTEPLLRTFILNARLAQVSNQLKTTARMARLWLGQTSEDESSAPGVSDTTIVRFLPCSLPRKASDVATCSNGMRLQLDERAALPSVELSVHSWPWIIDALADFCDGMVSDPVQLPPVLHNWVRTKTGTWELDTWVGW